MTDRDDFLERLRSDAAALRYQVDEATLARIRARIHERIAEPEIGVAALLASWVRPLVAAVAAIALVAGIGIAAMETNRDATLAQENVEIIMAGDTYVVGD